MSEESKGGLAGLIGTQAPEVEAVDEAEDAAAVLLLSIKTSLEERDVRIDTLDKRASAQDIEIRILKSRLSTMETMVSYLLEQDPGMQERMKAMADAAAKATNAKE